MPGRGRGRREPPLSPPVRKRNSRRIGLAQATTIRRKPWRISADCQKDDVKAHLVTRRTRDVLDRALAHIASSTEDVAVLQNNAEDSVGLISTEDRSSMLRVSVRLNQAGAVTRLDEVAHARKHQPATLTLLVLSPSSAP